MESFNVSVLISNSNGTEKSFEESHEGSLNSLISALKNVKDKTNEYLTELVAEEKRNKNQKAEHVEKTNEEEEESDVEVQEDYIDSKIKKELLFEQSNSHSLNKSDKRTRTYKKTNKKQKH